MSDKIILNGNLITRNDIKVHLNKLKREFGDRPLGRKLISRQLKRVGKYYCIKMVTLFRDNKCDVILALPFTLKSQSRILKKDTLKRIIISQINNDKHNSKVYSL